MNKILSIIFLSILSLNVYSQNIKNSYEKAMLVLNQSKLEKANALYNGFAYFEAARLYEELAFAKYDSSTYAPKLGDCYFNMSKTEKAEKWYKKALQNDSIDAVYFYKYAQTLRCNKKYTEAEVWLQKYQEKKAEDSRAKNYINNKDYYERIKNQKSFYNVQNMSVLNSEFSDFGAVQYDYKIAFATARDLNMIIKNNYAWNEKPFLDIMVYDSMNVAKNKFSNFGSEINTKFHEGPLCFDSTETTVYFTRNNYYQGQATNSEKGINNLLLFKATKSNGVWSNIQPLPFNNKEYSVGHPALSKDGKKLFFVSNMPGGFGGTDIYYVDINSDGFGTPINLGPNINTEGNEMFPFVNENNIYFSSDGHIGLGGLDVFYTKFRADGTFKNIMNLGVPVNSSMDDFCFVLNKDNRSGFLSSNRDGGKGDDDIYQIIADGFDIIKIEVLVLDSTNNEILKEAKVQILNENGEKIEELITDSLGKINYYADYGMKYKIVASKNSYDENFKTISTENVKTQVLRSEIKLFKQEAISLRGIIKDKNTSEPISDVKIVIKDLASNSVIIDTITQEKGNFAKDLLTAKVGDNLKYEVTISKTGYLAKTIEFTHSITKPGIIDMNEFLDIALDKIDVGADIGKIININPIYFDLNKSNIRPDAAIELEKIVKVMTENPTMVIELGSHTDCRATAKYNLDLSDKRAKSSAAYIVSKGISKERIYGKGYGEKKLVNGCACEGAVKSECSEEEHQLNRRTEFIIVKM